MAYMDSCNPRQESPARLPGVVLTLRRFGQLECIYAISSLQHQVHGVSFFLKEERLSGGEQEGGGNSQFPSAAYYFMSVTLLPCIILGPSLRSGPKMMRFGLFFPTPP